MKRLKQFILRHFYVKNSENLDKTAFVDKNTVLEGKNYIGKCSNVRGSTIGFQSYIGDESDLQSTSVGKFSCISHHVVVVQGEHPVDKFLSIHPAFFDKDVRFSYVNSTTFDSYKYFDTDKKIACKIGNDVWIGYGVLILAGVQIGDGAIIGAGSIVTKDVDPYTIVAGVPAKPIRKRFTEESIKILEEIRWWDKNEEWLKQNAQKFKDASFLLKNIRNQ